MVVIRVIRQYLQSVTDSITSQWSTSHPAGPKLRSREMCQQRTWQMIKRLSCTTKRTNSVSLENLPGQKALMSNAQVTNGVLPPSQRVPTSVTKNLVGANWPGLWQEAMPNWQSASFHLLVADADARGAEGFCVKMQKATNVFTEHCLDTNSLE